MSGNTKFPNKILDDNGVSFKDRDYEIKGSNRITEYPSGGIAGQILTKLSCTDNDVGWKNKDCVNVKDYGAIGDGITDDTDAFQNAINHCTANRKTLYVTDGVFKITEPLVLAGALSVQGGNLNTGQENTTINLTSGTSLFTQGENTNLYRHAFKNLYFDNDAGDATLFDISFRGGLVEGCKSNLFHTIFSRSIKGVTIIQNNNFYAIKGFFLMMDTGFSAVDSQILNNYISGYQPLNPTCFGYCSISSMIISGNYIDYFKYGFNADKNTYSSVYFQRNLISNNIFDVMWRCFYGQITNSVITGNKFTNMDASKIGKSPFFTNPDAEMIADIPYAFVGYYTRPMTDIIITNNSFACNAIYIDTAMLNVMIDNNTYSVPELNHFKANKSTGGNITKVFVDFLHRTTEDTLPSVAFNGLNGSYDGREIIFKDRVLYYKPDTVDTAGGGNGWWLNSDGIEVTESTTEGAIITSEQTPASSTAIGKKGDVVFDANYVYVCIADNTWKRSPLTTW